MAREVEPPDLRDRLARLHLVAEIDEHLEHSVAGREMETAPLGGIDLHAGARLRRAFQYTDMAQEILRTAPGDARRARRRGPPTAEFGRHEDLSGRLAGGVVHAHRVDLAQSHRIGRAESPHRSDAGGLLVGVVATTPTKRPP